MPAEIYKQFAFNQERSHNTIMNETLPKVIPGFRDITKTKKANIVDNFDE